MGAGVAWTKEGERRGKTEREVANRSQRDYTPGTITVHNDPVAERCAAPTERTRQDHRQTRRRFTITNATERAAPPHILGNR